MCHVALEPQSWCDSLSCPPLPCPGFPHPSTAGSSSKKLLCVPVKWPPSALWVGFGLGCEGLTSAPPHGHLGGRDRA
ncbi:unnamed protein product [Gulo gulo]|uniref:Uncharacterized protein n=1 Tax=Gulo gulo TaxID=48420 RepID=A0A9X9Q903_GULGU|nr:unnamed protein product [Gulo gulo]